MTHLNRGLREQLNAIPLPGLSDGSGRLAEWGAGIRPDRRWGVYYLADGRHPSWSEPPADGPRQAVAMSAHLNARTRGDL